MRVPEVGIGHWVRPVVEVRRHEPPERRVVVARLGVIKRGLLIPELVGEMRFRVVEPRRTAERLAEGVLPASFQHVRCLIDLYKQRPKCVHQPQLGLPASGSHARRVVGQVLARTVLRAADQLPIRPECRGQGAVRRIQVLVLDRAVRVLLHRSEAFRVI